MLTVLGTLPFMAALAIAAVALVRMLQESGGKIVAALKGEPKPSAPVLWTKAVTVRMSPRPERLAVRPTPRQWSAAA